MGIFYRRVGDVTFERIVKGGRKPNVRLTVDAADVIPGCKVGEITVSILEDKRVFNATEFAAFCTEENAEKMVKDHVMPLLKWVANHGE